MNNYGASSTDDDGDDEYDDDDDDEDDFEGPLRSTKYKPRVSSMPSLAITKKKKKEEDDDDDDDDEGQANAKVCV